MFSSISHVGFARGALGSLGSNAATARASTGASPMALLRTALALRKNERLTRSQVVMAANAPILAKRAMEEGDPVNGYPDYFIIDQTGKLVVADCANDEVEAVVDKLLKK